LPLITIRPLELSVYPCADAKSPGTVKVPIWPVGLLTKSRYPALARPMVPTKSARAAATLPSWLQKRLAPSSSCLR
jgi:hypothetical protein